MGEALQEQAHQGFHCWQRVRHVTLAHPTFASYMRPIRREAAWLLETGPPLLPTPDRLNASIHSAA
jgi:hypothetical protein